MNYVDEKLYDEICASSNILAGDDYKKLVCAVAKVAADMVVQTLGPYGATTVIDDGTGFTYPSKDGWSCLNKLQFTDPTYNTIYAMLKRVSFNSVTTVGDGTTTAMVAADNFLNRLYTYTVPKLTNGKAPFRQADFIEAVTMVSEKIISMLKENPNIQKIDVEGDFSDIYNIAYIATNGNEDVSKIIQQIYADTKNPNIHVQLDKDQETTYEIQHGYKFDARVLNHAAYANSANGDIDYVDTMRRVVVFDHNVNFQSHNLVIASLSALANKENMDIVIMAPYFDDIIASWINSTVQKMIQNRQVPNIMLVQIPTVSEIHKLTLADLSVLTNAQIFDDAKVKAFNILHHNQTHPNEEDKIKDDLLSLENYSFDSPEDILYRCLGRIRTLTLTKTEGFIRDFSDIANSIHYNAILKEAEEEYQEAKIKANKRIGGTLDKEFLFKQMRNVKLKGSTGVIKVGAISDIQQRCDKDSIDDAVLACKSAFENGYVRGMSVEILKALSHLLVSEKELSAYERAVIDTLYHCFYMTSILVMNNKIPDNEIQRNITVESQPVIGTAIDDDGSHVAITPARGRLLNNYQILDLIIADDGLLDYNLRTETMNPVGKWTVINSAATDIEILRAVVNVLTMVMTSTQFISMTRRYDEKITKERMLKHELEEETRRMATKTSAVLDTILASPFAEKLIFGDRDSDN